MTTTKFELIEDLKPLGSQPQAIQKLVDGINNGIFEQVLLGVTGSGKTFTIANVIAKTNRPALIMAPNKTLAAQLYQEFKTLFPNNCIEYFISYYDFYQPEAYIPSTDTFIDKSSVINDDIDKMRHSATRALFERRDTIIISSVSCIYGLGAPDEYMQARIQLEVGQPFSRDNFIRSLLSIHYMRNDISLERAKFRVRGDSVELVPAYEKDFAFRIQFFANNVEKITKIDALKGTTVEKLNSLVVFPATHYVLNSKKVDPIVKEIKSDLKQELKIFRDHGNFLEAGRLEQRTLHDIEMIKELGYCQGVENYSRYLDGRIANAPPSTLLDYFPKDYLLIIDESHVTVPQVGGMYRGDRARKETLVKYGFRLTAALDNRPLNFEEFKTRMGQTIYVSATPGNYELEKTQGAVVEQIIRPTGLIDPIIEIRKATGQIDNLIAEIPKVTSKNFRVLVTTLTKKMAEEITLYMQNLNIKVQYLHSEIDSMTRVEVLRNLRLGVCDVLVGINLLREGLDLPEVALVAILDADKEGFLRSKTSLIQTVGRAARNEEGRVILYADTITKSISACCEETNRRREIQIQYNTLNNITPQTIHKKIPDHLKKLFNLDYGDIYFEDLEDKLFETQHHELLKDPKKINKYLEKLKKEMLKASQKMEFEHAAKLRDEIYLLQKAQLELTKDAHAIQH